MVNVFKIWVNQKLCIGIAFDVSNHIFANKLKSLTNIKTCYLQGHYYLPYTKQDYREFLALKVPFAVSDKRGTARRTAPMNDVSSIPNSGNSTIPSKLVSSKVVDIKSNRKAKRIVSFNSGKFIIDIPYSKIETNFIKSLKSSYWHGEIKKWIAKPSYANLEKLQSRYACFSEKEYDHIEKLISDMTQDYTVTAYNSPEFKDSYLVKICGRRADLSLIKRLPERVYLKDIKTWRIPNNQAMLTRLLSAYEKKGAIIKNKLSYPDGERHKRKVNFRNYLNRLLIGVRPEDKTMVTGVFNCLINQGYSQRTIKSYIGRLLAYSDYLPMMPIQKRTAEDANNFINKIILDGGSESWVNVSISAIKFYYEKVLFVPEFQIEKLKRPRKGRTLPTFLSKKEVKIMLQSVSNFKHLTILQTIYSSGIRLGEVLNIRLEDIYWDRNMVLIKRGKGKKDRMVTLSEVLKRLLRRYFDTYQPSVYLFEGTSQGSPYSSSSVTKIVKKAAKKANITRKVTPHTLRHSFATHLMDGGIDTRYIQKLLGHKDIKTTMIYTHVTMNKIEDIKSPLDSLYNESFEKVEK